MTIHKAEKLRAKLDALLEEASNKETEITYDGKPSVLIRDAEYYTLIGKAKIVAAAIGILEEEINGPTKQP